MTTSRSLSPEKRRRAYPLPAKIPGWEPLHLTFRHAKLPELPVIHDPHIWSVLRNSNYERSSGPSGHSIKTLAWMGDAVLYLASTKACLRAGLNSGNHKRLQSIRGGLTTNRTFSYLTLSYRLHDLLGQKAFTDHNQKRYADYFEAYIGAAWESAKATQDPLHARAIEKYLSLLFKPDIWPALESLTSGSTDLITTIRFDQQLGDGESADDNDISIFDIPPPRSVPTKQNKKALKILKKKERMKKMAEITERNRQLAIADRIKAKQAIPTKGGYSTPIKYKSQAGPSRASILRDRSAERRWQSAITNRVAKKLNARSSQTYATPIKSKLSIQTTEAGPSCKIFRLKPGDTVEEEVDMDLDSDWEDVRIVSDSSRPTRIDRHVGKEGPGGTAGVPIVIE